MHKLFNSKIIKQIQFNRNTAGSIYKFLLVTLVSWFQLTLRVDNHWNDWIRKTIMNKTGITWIKMRGQTLRKKEIHKRGVLRSSWFLRRVQRQLCDPLKSKSRALWYQQWELTDYRTQKRASDWPIPSRWLSTTVRYWYRFFLWNNWAAR